MVMPFENVASPVMANTSDLLGQLQTPLGRKSDSHEGDNVVLQCSQRAAAHQKHLRQFAKPRRHCCNRTSRSKVSFRREPRTLQCGIGLVVLVPAKTASFLRQPPCHRGHSNLRHSEHPWAFEAYRVLHTTVHSTYHAVNLHGGGACIGQVSLPQKSASTNESAVVSSRHCHSELRKHWVASHLVAVVDIPELSSGLVLPPMRLLAQAHCTPPKC